MNTGENLPVSTVEETAGAPAIIEGLRKFIASNAPARTIPPAGIPAGADLLDHGFIDSLGLLDLVGFMEREYGVKMEDRDLRGENLDTLEHCARFIISKKGGAGRA